LQVLHPRFTAAGEAARALAAGLAHVAPKQGARPNPSTREMQALRAAGLRTGEIARRLSVSRMTVWRRLQAAQSIDATD
jgi:DNA invertase Pin-like site-specific DNA recombinase